MRFVVGRLAIDNRRGASASLSSSTSAVAAPARGTTRAIAHFLDDGVSSSFPSGRGHDQVSSFFPSTTVPSPDVKKATVGKTTGEGTMTRDDDFEGINEAKANLDHIYDQPDPRAYFRELKKLRYAIPGAAKPIFQKLISSLQRRRDDTICVLDLGCSYGVNAALLKHDLSMSENLFSTTTGGRRDWRMLRRRKLLIATGAILPISTIRRTSR